VDSVSGVNGTVVGQWGSTTIPSIVSGIEGTAFYKAGGTAQITLPANAPAHALSHFTFSFYYQPELSDNPHTLFAVGDLTQPGDLVIRRLTDGRLFGAHVGQDGGLRHFGSMQGVEGTDLVAGNAYRISIAFTPSGARLYLDNTRVA